jgi:acrylyl-CoA reductase (NADPH)
MFNALLIEKDEAGYRAGVKAIDDTLLSEGDVTVAVKASTINYKDGLAITGKSPVVRKFPMVAGIDFAGTVEHSSHPRWKAGDVKGDWLVPLPSSLSEWDAMAIGTAGYTAMLCLMALQGRGLKPADGDVLVTGANGGVGSVAIALLARAGFRVVASTGRVEEAEGLKALGAAEVLHRDELAKPGKPLAKERFAGVVDSVGSHTLANACAAVRYGGAVAACGLAQGMDFPGSVAPFILRGITLFGIDSVMAPLALRQQAWDRLAVEWDAARFAPMVQRIGLEAAVAAGSSILAGQVRGRLVVDVNA